MWRPGADDTLATAPCESRLVVPVHRRRLHPLGHGSGLKMYVKVPNGPISTHFTQVDDNDKHMHLAAVYCHPPLPC